jgi:polysaccharide export outer membrane protein
LDVDTADYRTSEVPTVFSVDLATAEGFFLSQSFQLHNRDVILASDAPYEDLTKAFALFNQIAVVPVATAQVIATFQSGAPK